jgi:hypothetical protein
MNKSTLMIATLLAALAGSVHAQTATPAAPASTDPIVQMRAEQNVADKAYSEKKKALSAERSAKAKAAGDAAAADAKAKGADPMVASRNAESKVKSATKADYDAKMKVLKKEHADATAAIKKKYPAPKA